MFTVCLCMCVCVQLKQKTINKYKRIYVSIKLIQAMQSIDGNKSILNCWREKSES